MSIELQATFSPTMLELFYGGPPEPSRHAVLITTRVPARLRTGSLRPGDRRVDHANRVRLARLRRRVARRAGVPVTTNKVLFYHPNVAVQAIPGDSVEFTLTVAEEADPWTT